MAFVHKCPNCGLELTDEPREKCPGCGLPAAGLRSKNIWIGAALQIGFSSIFMLVFGFPKIMIVIFVGLILIGTAVTSHLKAKPPVPRGIAPRPLAHPVLSRIVGFGIVLSGFAMFCILLFGLVMFLDSWNRWHEYEGQPFQRSEFVVRNVYYQKQSKTRSFYASGTVEGQREWMSLQPYLHRMPRSQAEAEASVPSGTSIPIYFFPNMKGRARVQVYEETPPAESAHRMSMKILNTSLLWLAIAGAALFVLMRIRGWCVAEQSMEVQSRGATVGG